MLWGLTAVQVNGSDKHNKGKYMRLYRLFRWIFPIYLGFLRFHTFLWISCHQLTVSFQICRCYFMMEKFFFRCEWTGKRRERNHDVIGRSRQMGHRDGEGEQHVMGAWEEKKDLGQDQEFPDRILRRISFPYRKWHHSISLKLSTRNVDVIWNNDKTGSKVMQNCSFA